MKHYRYAGAMRLVSGAAFVACAAFGAGADELNWAGPPAWVTNTFGPYVFVVDGILVTASVADIDGVSLANQPTDVNPFGLDALWVAGNFQASPSSELVLSLEFSEPVSGVSFTMYDLDSKGSAFETIDVIGRLGPAGSPASLSGVATGSGVDYDGSWRFSGNGTSNGNPPNPDDTASLTIADDIDRLTIAFSSEADGVGVLFGNITFTPPSCIGDIDGDGDTDVFDFGYFATNFGRTDLAPGTGGDLDGDGDVDVFDFALFGPDFGCSP